jgi:hypothetical protein
VREFSFFLLFMYDFCLFVLVLCSVLCLFNGPQLLHEINEIKLSTHYLCNGAKAYVDATPF